MATLTVQQVTRAGITPSYASCAGGGDEFANDGKTLIHVKNGHTSPQTVQVTIQKTVDGESAGTKDVAVTNAQERMIGPFPTDIYNDNNGKVQLTYSGVTSLTIGVFRI